MLQPMTQNVHLHDARCLPCTRPVLTKGQKHHTRYSSSSSTPTILQERDHSSSRWRCWDRCCCFRPISPPRSLSPISARHTQRLPSPPSPPGLPLSASRFTNPSRHHGHPTASSPPLAAAPCLRAPLVVPVRFCTGLLFGLLLLLFLLLCLPRCLVLGGGGVKNSVSVSRPEASAFPARAVSPWASSYCSCTRGGRRTAGKRERRLWIRQEERKR